MRLPRDVGGDDLITGLVRFGYEPTRQTGSHVRLTRETREGQQHVTVPRHKPLRVGTLNSVLTQVSEHMEMTKEELLEQLF